MLMVQLGEAGGHLAAAGAGGGDNHQRTGGFDIVVAAKALVADDMRYVGGIIVDLVVAVDLDAQILHVFLEGICGVLTRIACQNNASHVKADATEAVDKAHDLAVVGDAQVSAILVVFNVGGVDGNDDLGLVCQSLQHTELGIGRKAGKDTGGVVIVEQLPAEFHVKLASEGIDSVTDLLGLQLDVGFVAEAFFSAFFCGCVCVCHEPFPLVKDEYRPFTQR